MPPRPTSTLTLTSTSSSLYPSKTHDSAASSKSSDASASEDDRPHRSRDKSASKPKKSKICEALGRLGIYTHSAHFSSFSASDATSPAHVYSVSESDILELHEKQERQLWHHNKHFLMRAYPSGRRIDSSNPDPSLFWRRGVQMVAINWQKLDEGGMVNHALFNTTPGGPPGGRGRGGGLGGWVLKPRAYRPRSHMKESEEGEAPEVAIKRVTLDVSVTVLAGMHVPLPSGSDGKNWNPYVKVELHVDRAPGEKEGGGRTKDGKWKLVTEPSRCRKGDHPDWGVEGARLEFRGVVGVVEELGFIRRVLSVLSRIVPFCTLPRSPLHKLHEAAWGFLLTGVWSY